MVEQPQQTAFQPWQSLLDPDLDATIYQRGQHSAGTYIRVYVPRAAERPGESLRVILYLHGFALGLPCFYEAHLRELVRQGWVVIFPDFQFSAYPDLPLAAAADAVQASSANQQAQAQCEWSAAGLQENDQRHGQAQPHRGVEILHNGPRLARAVQAQGQGGEARF